MQIIYSSKDLEKIAIANYNKEKNEKDGIFFCTKEDELYPTELKKLKNAPSVLYYKGNIKAVNEHKNIAIIGSRQCSDDGERISYDTGKYIAQENLNVINGLALGCDEAALRGALDNNGKCIVLLPSGLDNIQPKSNRSLSDEIVEKGGCLISEYPVGSELKKYNYVERDRLQSGISQGVIVIEAGIKSGTMHTVDYAMKQYKRLACYYHGLLEYSTGNKYLEETGSAHIIRQNSNLIEFVKSIKEEKSYEQMTLNLF